MSRSAETWSLAESTSYHYLEMLRKPGDERLRQQYEWMRDKYLAAVEKEKQEVEQSEKTA